MILSDVIKIRNIIKIETYKKHAKNETFILLNNAKLIVILGVYEKCKHCKSRPEKKNKNDGFVTVSLK